MIPRVPMQYIVGVQWPGEADTCVGTHTASDWSISHSTGLWLAQKCSSHSPSISLHEPCQVRTELRTTVRRESESSYSDIWRSISYVIILITFCTWLTSFVTCIYVSLNFKNRHIWGLLTYIWVDKSSNVSIVQCYFAIGCPFRFTWFPWNQCQYYQ